MTGTARVAVVMGSSSDWSTMAAAVAVLERFGIEHRAEVLSAHRMPDEMFAFAERAEADGLRAIIAGAGVDSGTSVNPGGGFERNAPLALVSRRTGRLPIPKW